MLPPQCISFIMLLPILLSLAIIVVVAIACLYIEPVFSVRFRRQTDNFRTKTHQTRTKKSNPVKKAGSQPASKLACLSSRRYVRLSVCPPANVSSIHPAVGSNIRPSVCSSNHSRFCFPSTASKPSSCSNTKNVRLFTAAFLWLLQFFCILSLLVLACGICCKMRNFTFVCVIESKNLYFACFLSDNQFILKSPTAREREREHVRERVEVPCLRLL